LGGCGSGGGFRGRRRGRRRGIDADAPSRFELDLAVDQAEEREIAAGADVLVLDPPGAALAHDDAAGPDHLAVADLDAETLGMGVAAVLGRAAAFLMCHRIEDYRNGPPGGQYETGLPP